MTYLHDLWLRHTLPKKTKPPALDLSTPEGYEKAAGIRGPDSMVAGSLKWVFTARIRWLTGARMTTSYSTRQGRLSIGDISGLKAGLRRWWEADTSGLRHYLEHMSSAADALGNHNLARLAVICQRGALDTTSDEEIIRLAGGD